MFKKAGQAVREAAENAGLMAVSVADAERAAEDRRMALVDAQRAVEAAEAEVERLYDIGAKPSELHTAEAILAGRKLDAERAQRAHASAERRYAKARDADRERAAVEGREQRDRVLTERATAGGEIAAMLAGLKDSLARLDAADARLSALQAAGHVKNASFGPQQSRARIAVACEDILHGTPAPRTEPFDVWIEYQNNTARVADEPQPVEVKTA